jgi:hypothetical protein
MISSKTKSSLPVSLIGNPHYLIKLASKELVAEIMRRSKAFLIFTFILRS